MSPLLISRVSPKILHVSDPFDCRGGQGRASSSTCQESSGQRSLAHRLRAAPLPHPSQRAHQFGATGGEESRVRRRVTDGQPILLKPRVHQKQLVQDAALELGETLIPPAHTRECGVHPRGSALLGLSRHRDRGRASHPLPHPACDLGGPGSQGAIGCGHLYRPPR